MYNVLNEANSGITFDTMLNIAKGTINVATGVAQYGEGAKRDGYSYSSVAKAASKMVAVFPVLASRTVSADTAQMVSKYIEQKMCSLFVLALQQANISTAKSGIEYLRQYHQNLDIGGDDVNAILKTMDTWIQAYNDGKAMNESGGLSSYMYESDVDADSILEADTDLNIPGREVIELMKIMQEQSMIKVYDTQLNPISINDYIVNEFASGDYHVSVKAFNEADNGKNNTKGGLRKEYRDKIGQKDGYKDRDDAFVAQGDRDADDNWTDPVNERKVKQNSGGNVSLKDLDVKKMNDAIPSMLVVRFYSMYKDDNNNNHLSTIPTEFIIGVKSKLIPVATTEILRRIMNDNKDGKKFIKFMRTITGELKLSEVIFGLSQIKDDIRSTRKKGAYGSIWNLLVTRANASKEALRQGAHNDFSAITTVVVSQNDVDELFHEENFDISDPKNAIHFMQSYNLISFIIVDDATQIAKIMMDDGSKEFEEYAYRMFERETRDGTYKKLINLMAASK